MAKKKIVTVIGARPQFIKASVISNKIKESTSISETIVHTGQHYDDNMSTVFFKDLNIPSPKYNLGIHKATHGAMIAEMMISIEEIFTHEKPSIVLVYGDTNSTLAGALTAAKMHIPVAHIESGLRSGIKTTEEINRHTTDHLSDIHFCSSKASVANLRKENIIDNVYHTGDLTYNTFYEYRDRIDYGEILDKYNLEMDSFIYFTFHRAENTDNLDRLTSIIQFLNSYSLGKQRDIIFPIHPRTYNAIQANGLEVEPHVKVIQPINYFDSIALTTCSDIVITDSGGIQREAFYVKKPCIILREKTEWMEFVDKGWAIRWGIDEWKTHTSNENTDCMNPEATNEIVQLLEKHI